jgi:hypothetical protein
VSPPLDRVRYHYSQRHFAVKTAIDDGQYGPWNESDTRELSVEPTALACADTRLNLSGGKGNTHFSPLTAVRWKQPHDVAVQVALESKL